MAEQTALGYANKAILGKSSPYNELWKYYEGEPELKYSTERLKNAFNDNINAYFAQNWCNVIIDSVSERLDLLGFTHDTEAGRKKLEDMFTKYQIGIDSDEVHVDALVTGEAFVVVDRLAGGEWDVYQNDSRMMYAYYNPSRPKLLDWAAKRWQDLDGTKLALYYPDRTELYFAEGRGSTTQAFKLVSSTPHDFGRVPVFHFRSSRRKLKPELDKSIRSQQDAVNKLISDMMVAAEFEAFKLRVIISKVDPGNLELGPDMFAWIPANEESEGQDTSFNEYGGSPLTNFLAPVEQMARAMAISSRTPKHYLFQQGGDPSGDALVAMEAPLNKKTKRRQETYGVTWVELASFLSGIPAEEISPVWAPIQTIQPKAQAEIIKMNVESTIPLKTALREAGWSKDRIDNLEADLSPSANDGQSQ